MACLAVVHRPVVPTILAMYALIGGFLRLLNDAAWKQIVVGQVALGLPGRTLASSFSRNLSLTKFATLYPTEFRPRADHALAHSA